MQKPDGLTRFSRSDGLNCIYLYIKFLTPDFGGHFLPADCGQGHWLFQYPKDVWAYWFLFSYQNIIKDNNGCIETLKKALEITENPAPVYNMLGYRYMLIGKNDEAAVVFDKYIELAPNNPNVYDSKGDYFMNIKEYSKAYDSFMKAYALDSTWSYKKAEKAKQLADSLQLK